MDTQPVATLVTAEEMAGHERMLAELAELRERSSEDNFYLGERNVKLLRRALQKSANQPPSVKQWQLLMQLGEFELRLGNERESLRRYSDAIRTGSKLPEKMPQGTLAKSLFELGIAFMRFGETENCCARNSPDSCLLPIRGSGIHTQRTGSEQAIAAFRRVLAATSPTSDYHLQAQWLLNLAYMTLGE
ncbi:MAG: hypothetical protein KDB23_29515, partial [Planctomycetales bacterium]|nr:hypothetical protein [Planctomycetales bacterium]